jgi:hypothetical protein
MKAEQVILQCVCGKVQKIDLIENAEPQVRISDLLER